MPAAGSGVGGSGGGADLDLVVQHVGLGEAVEKYRDLINEIRESKANINEAEIDAAKRLHEQAREAAAEFSEAAGVARKAGEESEAQSQVWARVFTDYKQLVTSIDALRDTLFGKDGEDADEGDGADGEAEGGKGKDDTIKKKVGDFFNIGSQAVTALGAGARIASSTITTMGVGGILGLLLYGIKTEERLRASGEQYAQLWEKSIGTADAKGYETAHHHMEQLGRQFADLVDTFRMSKAEANATTRALADTGVSIEEATAKTTLRVGGARASVAVANAALDTVLRLPEGTAAKASSQLMQQYGLGAVQATEMTERLAMTARDAGVGVQAFLSDVMSATGQMRQYGVVIDDGIELASGLQRMLEERGLKHHAAGAIAMMATGSIAAGMANMSQGLQILIAEDLGMGTGIAGVQALHDVMYDPEKGPGMWRRMMVALVNRVKGTGDQTREQVATVLEGMLPALGPQGALLMVDHVNTLARTNATKKERADATRALDDAWKKERDTHTDWEVGFKDVARDVAGIGLAMFNLMASSVAILVTDLRMLPVGLTEWMGGLAKKFGLKGLASAIPGADTILKFAATDPLMAVAIPGAAITAKAVVYGGLSPAERDLKSKLLAVRQEAQALQGRSIGQLGTHLTDLIKHAPELAPATRGMQALAVATSGTQAAINQIVTNPTVRAIGRGALMAASTSPLSGAMRAAEGANPIAGTSAPESDAGDSGGGGEDVTVDITRVEMGAPRPNNDMPISVHYRVRRTPRVRQREAPHRQAAVQATIREQAPRQPSEGGGLLSAFPVGTPGAPGGPTYSPGSWGAIRADLKGGHHAGDIFADPGTPVFAPVTGRVSLAHSIPNAGGAPGSQAEIGIRDAAGYKHHFLHMEAPPMVRPGQEVQAGDQIGKLAPAAYNHFGNPTAPHLHYELRDKNNNLINFYKDLRAVDPREDVGEIGLTPEAIRRGRRGRVT